MYFRDSVRRYKDTAYHSIQLVASVRHPETRKPTTQVIASLGDLSSLDEAGKLGLIVSLSRVLGVLDLVTLSSAELALADLSAASAKARSVGAMWAILEILRQLHLPDIWQEITADRGNAASLAKHLTALICHRLDDPGSKLSLLRWIDGVLIPGVDSADITYQGLLRTMDVLMEHKGEIEQALANRVLTLFDSSLDLVLTDVTSVSVCGQRHEAGLFAHGHSRDGHPERRQYVLLMVTTKDGIPLYHEVHPGNTADVTVLDAAMKQVRGMFPGIDRCLVVADRGMLSEANLTALASLGFNHLVALPLKRETSTRAIIDATHEGLLERAGKVARGHEPHERVPDVTTEVAGEQGRVIVAFSMAVAERQRREREAKLDAFEGKAAVLEARLQGKVPVRGRPLTDVGAFKQLLTEALEARMTAYFRIELRKGAFLWVEPLEEAIAYAERCDGKLALHTDDTTLDADELVRIYKDLQEIERSWHVLKSHVGIRPTFHWTERRVRAHVFVCVLALTVERVMRLRLKAAGSACSPQRALEQLRRLTHVRLTVPQRSEPLDVLANKAPEQLDLYRHLAAEPLTDARLRQLV
jgi:transposase